jgi:hypothetical protein
MAFGKPVSVRHSAAKTPAAFSSRRGRMVGMVERSNWKAFGVIAGVVLATVALPAFLIVLVLLEETYLTTRPISNVYKAIGIYDPLEWLWDNTVMRFL